MGHEDQTSLEPGTMVALEGYDGMPVTYMIVSVNVTGPRNPNDEILVSITLSPHEKVVTIEQSWGFNTINHGENI